MTPSPGRDAQLAFAFVVYGAPHRSGGGRVAAPIAADFLKSLIERPGLAAAYLPEERR